MNNNRMSIKKMIFLAFAMLLVGCAISTNVSAASYSFAPYISGGYAYSDSKNTSGSTKYCTNTIFKTTARTSTGGTSLVNFSGTVSNNNSTKIKTKTSNFSYAYAKFVMYRGSAYESGVQSSITHIYDK